MAVQVGADVRHIVVWGFVVIVAVSVVAVAETRHPPSHIVFGSGANGQLLPTRSLAKGALSCRGRCGAPTMPRRERAARETLAWPRTRPVEGSVARCAVRILNRQPYRSGWTSAGVDLRDVRIVAR